MIIPVILSGGSGTRLWPVSRRLHPKQFINLINDKTLFQETVLRLPKNITNPLIICNEDHRFLAAEQLRQIDIKPVDIILEPFGKNTAAAVTLAALNLINKNPDAILLVLSADHYIEDVDAFHKSIKNAEIYADNDKLVTFGVTPTKPETGYGYIKADLSSKKDAYPIKLFTEKPTIEVARSFIQEGGYYWNSGIFMFKASVFLEEIEKFEPKILSACRKSFLSNQTDIDFVRLDKAKFDKSPEKSIDYAIMEKTKKGVVVPLSSSWNDIGSWDSLWNIKEKDKNGNVIEGDVLLDEVIDSYVKSENRLVSAIGVQEMIIVETQDSLLVANKKYSQKINLIVSKLNDKSRKESFAHRKVYRPWGYYDSLDIGERFQVKRICITPGSKISLQKHNYRAEHWVIVKGIALITKGEKVIELHENQSTFIPIGEIHRLENQQKTPLEIIEIQTGSYLGEDDILRLEDDYNRK